MTFEMVRMRVGDETGAGRTALAAHPVVRPALTGKPRLVERSETGFDTPERKLWRAGMTLTAHRQGLKWLATLARVPESGEVSREWECGSAERPDWSELKRHLPDALLAEGIKSKSLEPLFRIAQREERWRLEYPDGSRITIRELRGQWIGPTGEEPFHEVVLEASGGVPLRFLQTALAVGRHFSATLEPLDPVARGLSRLDPDRFVPVIREEVACLPGDRVCDGLVKAGEFWVRDMQAQLAPLAYGSDGIALGAVFRLLQATAGLRRLITWFGDVLPESLRRDMEGELAWLSGALSPVCAGAELSREILPRMRRRFLDDPQLEGALSLALGDWQLALKQARRAVDSVRFTRLFMGFAIWLSGEEGVKAAVMESDVATRERLGAPVEGMAREVPRRLHRGLIDAGRKEPGFVAAPEEVAGVLTLAEGLEQALGLFGGLLAERKGTVTGMVSYRQAVMELVRAGRVVVALHEAQHLWQRRFPVGSADPVVHLFRGWQGAGVDGALTGYRQAWEAFVAVPAPWVRD
ncbi:MAG: hypothetical protein HQL98_09535 [Magnetococcales bacterium]|nr:hypothetical protein [Magnetococcales bacterium]